MNIHPSCVSHSYLVDFLVMAFLQLRLGAHEARMLADALLPVSVVVMVTATRR